MNFIGNTLKIMHSNMRIYLFLFWKVSSVFIRYALLELYFNRPVFFSLDNPMKNKSITCYSLHQLYIYLIKKKILRNTCKYIVRNIGIIIAVCTVNGFKFEGTKIMNEYGKTFNIFIKNERINNFGGFAVGENDRCL